MPANTPVVSKVPSACEMTYPRPRVEPEILSHNRAYHRESETGLQAREDPRQRARNQDVADELTLAGAEHPHVVDQHAIGVAHALIRAEEHHEEHQRHRQRHLRPDAEAEPEQEQRREHDARHRVQHLDVGIEDAGDHRRAAEREAEPDSQRRAGHQTEQRFFERDREMPPQRAGNRPTARSARAISEGRLTKNGSRTFSDTSACHSVTAAAPTANRQNRIVGDSDESRR